MDVLGILSKKLKELRKENNYSQQEIANLLGIAQVTYSHYELGRRSVSIQNLVKIARIYNVSTDYTSEMGKETPTYSLQTIL